MKSGVSNIGNILSRTARLRPDDIGLFQAEHQWTWRELEESANALAEALVQLGIGKSDRVMVQCSNNRYLFESMYAITRTGAVYIPLNARATAFETVQMANLCAAKAMIVSDLCAEKAEAACEGSDHLEQIIITAAIPKLPQDSKVNWHVYADLTAQYAGADTVEVDVDFDDICWLSFTSGTTGTPKGALTSHGTMAFVLNNRIADILPGIDHTHSTLAIGPLTHGTGTLTTVNTLASAKTVMLSGPSMNEEECWQLIEKHQITSLFTVPTILMRLLKHPSAEQYNHKSLRHVIYAGAPITQADQRFAMEKLGKVLVQYFGAAEFLGAGTVLYPDMHGFDESNPMTPTGSIGVARRGTDLVIMDAEMNQLPVDKVGEICLRGPGVFDGYYNNPEANAEVFEKGWYRTGDLGRMNDRGFIYIAGRIKEMYKSGGLQVYPNETQNHLAEHPAVDEAHVVSFPDSEWGEIGVAVLTLKKDHEASEDELKDFIQNRLARYKLPKRIFIWDEIPKSPNGKVPKKLLIDTLYERGLVKQGEDVS